MKRRVDKSFCFATGQAKGAIEIVRLKLRIIGFSNKRNDIYAHFGELAHRAIRAGEDVLSSETLNRMMDEIEEAGREIEQAKMDINDWQAKSRQERAAYFSADSDLNSGDEPVMDGSVDSSGGDGKNDAAAEAAEKRSTTQDQPTV